MANKISNKYNRGFTLIEVLLSVVIVTVIATAVARSSLNSINYALYNRQMASAYLLAESKLAELKAKESSINNKGNTDINKTKYKWTIEDNHKTVADINEKYSIDLVETVITVEWMNNAKKKEISIREYLWKNNPIKELP